MSFRKLIKLSFCAALFAAAGSASAVTELIVNGSFEANKQAANTWNIYNNLTGWTGGQFGIELRNNVAGAAFDGVNFVELDTTHNSLMYQNIHTTKGQAYTLSFEYSPRPGVALDSNGIEVLWNGKTVATEQAQGLNNGKNSWQHYSFNVIGGNDVLSRLEFRAVGRNDSYGGSLDKVSLISAVPEPDTYAMLLVGAGLIGFAARRKKNPKFN